MDSCCMGVGYRCPHSPPATINREQPEPIRNPELNRVGDNRHQTSQVGCYPEPPTGCLTLTHKSAGQGRRGRVLCRHGYDDSQSGGPG